MEFALLIAKIIAFIASHKAAIFFFFALVAVAYFWIDAIKQRKEIIQRQQAQNDAWFAKHFRTPHAKTFADARLQVLAGNDPFRQNHYN